MTKEDFMEAFGIDSMPDYHEMREGQEFYGNGYAKGVSDIANNLKHAVADEFKYRAKYDRTNYSTEEIIQIVGEVINEVVWENKYGKRK